MDTSSINDYFGDMDLPLMDCILKGHIPENGQVLDVGCGEGRNAIYFLQGNYHYVGLDHDKSKIDLLKYLCNQFTHSSSEFQCRGIENLDTNSEFDVVICSRVLHFAKSEDDLLTKWKAISNATKSGGVVYVAMDSAIENTLAVPTDGNCHEFPDGKIRFALTEDRYQKMKKGFEEIEPLKTLVQHQTRAQSFILLRKL